MKPIIAPAASGYGCEDVELRGFVSLMDLYENNFLRLRRLIPDLSKVAESSVSVVSGCLPLHLRVFEHGKFTTTLLLTYYFDDAESMVAEPALTIRMYHDAQQVEVITGHLRHGRERYDHIPEMAKAVKWRLNRFLYKWLGYCLYLGHQFSIENITDQSTSQQVDLYATNSSEISSSQASDIALLLARLESK